MKILPIPSNKYNISSLSSPTNCNYDYSAINFVTKDTFTKSVVSFGIINSAGRLRNLAAKKLMHCVYCERPMQSDAYLSTLKRNGVFSGTIQNYVQHVFPLLNYLHPSEKEVFKRITMIAFDSPKLRLSEAIKKLYPEANKELLKEQIPILQEIATLGKELPRGFKSKFQYLMKITKYRLIGKEYIPKEFSGKEFAHKISRLSDTIKDEQIAQRIKKLTEPLSHPIFKNSKEPITEKFALKIFKLTERRETDLDMTTIKKSDLQLLLIEQIRKFAEILNRKDIKYNCDIAKKTILGQPVKIKFSNKAFRYDLNEILAYMPDKELKTKIVEASLKLPNSQTSVNSFITKHENSASDAIGYNILRPSRATIEHMETKCTKGPNTNKITNFVLACERCNNTRSNNDMKIFIENFNKNNHKRYFKELLEEVKKKNLDKKVFDAMLKQFQELSGRNVNL